MKSKLKEWSKGYKGNLTAQKNNLLGKLAKWDNILEEGALSDEEKVAKATSFMEYEEVIKNEEIYWRQRSRTQWLKEGDTNTKYFHKMASVHRRYNGIDQLQIQGVLTEDPAEIRDGILSFYHNLFTETVAWRPVYSCRNCPTISEQERDSLQANFEEQEVLNCLKRCAEDKTPGPEGFTMESFLKCWDIVKLDIMEASESFMKRRNLKTASMQPS